MTSIDSLKQDLSQKFPAEFPNFVWNHQFGDHSLTVPKESVHGVVSHFKAAGHFDFLMDVCGADYPERPARFEVVYHFFSSRNAQRLRLKTQLRENESVRTVTDIWRGADWFEREAYDMFGIRFDGHLNLRRLLTHHQFVGHPLRKDYDADRQQPCDEALPMHFDFDPNYRAPEDVNLVPLNIGPSHPSTHGTLRVMAELDGETVHRAGVELGFLHRCFEKMAETHPYNQVIPYTDRLNYCSAPMNNIGYCKTVERMMGLEIPPKAQAMRIILAELSRIIDHIVCLGANAVDLGALTGFFHLFVYREKGYP